MTDSAMVTVPCLVTVAAGVFARGHLGELTRYLPFELVDDVLERAGAVQRRMRMLPLRVGMYFTLAMTLFPGIGYLRVWDKMTVALDGLHLPRPSEKALCDLRRRIGAAVKARAGRELADRLGIHPRNMLTQLAEWTRLGFLAKTGPGRYALSDPSGQTAASADP